MADSDAGIYSAFCQHVERARPKANELLKLIEKGYDIVHLCCELNENGELTDEQGGTLKGDDLLETCRTANVKVLFIASDNSYENYLEFRSSKWPKGYYLDLVMVVNRYGNKFPYLMEELLKRMSKGKSLPMAWVELGPQGPGPWHDKLPRSMVALLR
jgi:hypothetical protein